VASLSTSTSTAIVAAKTHYYSVNDNGTQQANYANDGATGVNALAAGTAASASGVSSVAVGDGAHAAADGAVSIGQQSLTGATGAVAIGANATASKAGDVALGAGSVTSAANPTSSGTIGNVTYSYAGTSPTSVVSVGAVGSERQIINVAAGRVLATSTDAVNGSQLYATNMALLSLSTSTAASIGTLNTEISSLSTGLSTVASTTAIPPSALSTTNGAIASLSTSVGNISTSVTSLSTSITNAANTNGVAADMKGDGTDKPTVTAGSNSVAIGANSNDGGRSNVVSVGCENQQRQITNVAPGTQGTDAVNLNQLNSAIGGVQHQISQVARDAYSGVAAAMAMPNMTPSGPGKTVVAAGVASYLGSQAVGVGVTYRSESGRWLVNGAASMTSSGSTGVRAQVGYEF
jgi:autotransporter adhesin